MLLVVITLGHHPLQMGMQMCHTILRRFGHLLSLLGEDL